MWFGLASMGKQSLGDRVGLQRSSGENKYIIEASSSYNPRKVQPAKKERSCKVKVSRGDVIVFVRTITILAIEPTQKRKKKRRASCGTKSIDIRHARQKSV